jgi:hypothetical protein
MDGNGFLELGTLLRSAEKPDYDIYIYIISHQICGNSRISQQFKEPKGSSVCSLEQFTGPYPELDQSSPYPPSYLRLILILFAYLHVGIPIGLFLLALSSKSHMHSS